MLPSVGHTFSRRSFLLAAAAAGTLVVTSCTGRPRSTATGTRADPIEAVLKSHVALRDAYADALAGAPSLAALLTPLHNESIAHVDALAAAMAQRPPAVSASAASGSAGTATTPVEDPATILAGLRNLEGAAQQQTSTLATTIAATRAPLLGSIAASHACHLVVLG